MDSADTKPRGIQENLSQDDNDPGTLVVDILSDSGEDSARCMSDVDNGTMSAEDVQETSSKNVKDPESVTVGEHSNVPGKEEQELRTVVVDMHVETPSKQEQNTETLVGETHIDEPIKPEQDSLAVVEDTHIDELSEIEVELETFVKDTHNEILPKCEQNLKIFVEETHIDALVKPEKKLEMVVAEIFSDTPDKIKENLETVVTETHSNDPNTKEESIETNVAETHSVEPGKLEEMEIGATEKLIDTADRCKENMETVVEEAYIDAPGKNEENIKMVVEEIHINAPGRFEQNIETIVNETHEDAPVKNGENIETNVEERDADVFNKQEQNSDASMNSISISDLDITQEELVTINIFDSLQTDTLNEKKKCASGDGSPSSVNMPSLHTAVGNKVKKDLTSKTQDISVADDHKHIASDLKNVALMRNKPRLKKNLVSAPSNGLPIVSSKLPNIGQDSALSNTKVNIKKRGSLVVKTIGPRTIRNVSVDYSLNKGGVYVDPSGTILITREMDSGRTSDSPKEKAFPTLQNGNTHLSCSTSPHVKPKVKAKHSRKKLDNEPVTSKGSLIQKTLVDSTGSDEVLITTQLNDKLAVVHDTAPCKKYISANNSLTENGVYVDPSGSVLITREMDDGKACDSSRVRVFPTKNAKKVLSRKRRKANDEQNLTDLDNKPSTNQGNLSKKSRNSAGSGEVLSVKQHDELAAVDNGAAPIIYNTNTRYSLRKSGKYFDPSGTKLISRDRRNGNACNASKARAFSPPQNTNKHLPCSKVSQANIKVDKQNLTNLDNEHSSSQGSFTDNEEDLISNEPDLNDVDSSTASKNKMSKRGIKTVGKINNAYYKTQDGNRHNCCFCSHMLKKDEENTCLALNKPLPSSLLDITSLLKCLGISSPLPSSGSTKRNSSIVLCQYCYSLVSEGDKVYKKLLSVTSNMKQLWSDNDGENLTAPFSLNENDRSLKNTQGKCRPILTFPNMVKESHPVSSNVDGKMQELILKQQCSNNKMRICEFCRMDLYGRDWNLHQTAVHRVERKWRWYYLQPILKMLLAKEIHGVNKRQGEDSANGKYEKTNTRKCTACSKTFSLRDEFVDHLQHYHNMVIDEEFLSYIIDEDFWSYISDDAGFMDWSNNGDRENIENPIEIKSEVMSDDQDGGKSSASDIAHTNSIQDNDTINCKDAGKQDILHNGKGEKPHRNGESSALPVSDDCHNYIGTNGNKLTIMPHKDNFRKESRTDLCCRICTQSFMRQVDLEKHEQLHHPESVNESKTMRVKGHLKTSHGVNHLLPINSTKTKVSCKLCDKICDNAEDLNNHRDTCHENTVALQDHYGGDNDNVVEMSKTINLDVDNVNKESKFALKQKPNKIQSFKCNMCGDTFENRIMLVKHKRSCHAFEENCLEIMECDICGRKLHGIQYLHLHMSQVHNKPYNPPLQHQCNMCIHHCRTLNQLEEHLQEKHGVNMLPPVKCKEHGEMQSDKDIDIHICKNQKKMSSSFCAMQFKTKSSLEHHISDEHENKKWQCDKCHTEFEKYHLLQQHNMYIHSAKNYQCSQCEKSFKRKSDMISHGKNVHKKILSECTYCLKDFPDHKRLRTHIIRKHSTSWEVTPSKNYARHQQENSCMHKQQPRCSNTSPNSTFEETEKMEVQENKHNLEHTGEHVHYEKEQKENPSEQYQDSGPHEISQEQLTPVEETVVTEYEEVGVEALENPQEYNMVEVIEGTENVADIANICYIIVE